MSYYSKILRTVTLSSRAEKTRSFLATSPVKLLSTFLGSATNTHTPDAASSGSKHQRSVPSFSRNSQQSVVGSFRSKDSDAKATEEVRPENPLVRLEQTFMGYVAALESRKGAIIGRTLLNRSLVDELIVNDLYNRLIENPFDIDAAADPSTEAIFVALEKFLHIAWAERMGPVMTQRSLDTLLERANKRMPGEFADFVNFLFGDMAPQNRRAFTSLIRLLASLLDGCGNDSDRGALTLAFAEMLVTNGTAPNYINLLDRLVEDSDRIFEEPGLNHSFNLGNVAYESINSAIRGNTSYTPSLTSNTSSLRRKFGFDMLLRQNSKDERPSVWRSLSRHRNPATGESPSLSRATRDRTRSVDDSSLLKKVASRPGSRDRPPLSGPFDAGSRPASSQRHEPGLETIGEPRGESSAATSPKRKRRSSLSDLKSLMAAASLEDDTPRPLQVTKITSEKVNSTPPKPASPSKIPVTPGAVPSLRSPRQKENVADPFAAKVIDTEPVKAERPAKPESPVKRRGHSKTLSTSTIPTLKSVRPSTSGADSPSRPSTSPSRAGPQKLRLQSPQRLRERLQTERKAIDDVDKSLQSELSKIGAEMARVNDAKPQSLSVDLRQLSSSVRGMEYRLPLAMHELWEKHEAIQRDMETTLKASEAKVRAIDQLYKEAVAENELLYERFHGELGKIVKAIKGKGKEDKEELLTKLREQGTETVRLKKDNNRLKREIVSLRAALKGTE